ncbi:MAG: 50S ribosomal protein L32 [Candidatus Pacebacteria bacterium]|nr:50S ribosomal protein L32 [Candidatus Paceibacterota bacterium]
MTPLPKRRASTGRKGQRRAAISLKVVNLVACPNCHELRKPHQACPKCGFYKKKTDENSTRSEAHQKKKSG